LIILMISNIMIMRMIYTIVQNPVVDTQ